MRQRGHLHGLRLAQRDAAVVEMMLRHHQFGQCLGIGDDSPTLSVIGLSACGKPRQHLGAGYLIGSITLTIFHSAAITRRKEQRPLEVVVEVAGSIGVIADEKHRARFQSLDDRGEEQRYRGSNKSLEKHASNRMFP